MPDRIFVKLKYLDERSISAGAGSTAAHQYRGNSLYDPDFTGTGAQPTGLDEYAAFYSQYTVLGSAISVTIVNNSTNSLNVTVWPDTDSSHTGETVSFKPELNPYCRAKFISPGNAAAGWGQARLKNYMATAKMFGIPPSIVKGDPDYDGNDSSNPASPWYWVVSAYDYNLQAISVWMKVKMTFYAMFKERKNLNIST